MWVYMQTPGALSFLKVSLKVAGTRRLHVHPHRGLPVIGYLEGMFHLRLAAGASFLPCSFPGQKCRHVSAKIRSSPHSGTACFGV
jgi:hypothetical protein